MSAILFALLALGQSIADGTELSFSVADTGQHGRVEVRTDWFPGADSAVPSWWFERRTFGRGGRSVYRWTTAGACPTAAANLDSFAEIDVPAFINASDDAEIGIRTPVYRLEGTVYYAGGHVGRATFETTTDTRLAFWIDRMLAALDQCWSADRPQVR